MDSCRQVLESHPADHWVQAALDKVNELYKDEEYKVVGGDEHEHGEGISNKEKEDKKVTGKQ